jgi:primosomal protein N' (replication factor Y)
VPLGTRETVGVVWADNVPVRPGLHNRLKDVEAKLDYPPLREELRKFVDWVANYTLAPRGMVLRMALRMGELGPERERVGGAAVGTAATAHNAGTPPRDGGARDGCCAPIRGRRRMRAFRPA